MREVSDACDYNVRMGRKTVSVRSDRGARVCEACVVADSAVARMRGLLGRSELHEGSGLLLRPAGSIHTGFMRFPIDAVFLDRELRVLRTVSNLGPWRAARRRGTRAVLELPAGTCARAGLQPGDRLVLA